MSHGSNLEVDLLCQQNENEIKSADDWLAVKPQKYNTNELVNIVSLSVEMEKIIIVTREHNRVVTDDVNTKQWYGIYTVEQLYLIHQHFCQIDPIVDQYYPDQLRPIKGYLSTYFKSNLSQTVCDQKSDQQTIDLQDNFLCNLIRDYLKKCIEYIGVNLYVDILFNDLNSNDYFEIYSEFNLKRLQYDIDVIKELFEKIRPKEEKTKKIQKIDLNNEDYIWEFKRNLRNILQFYSQEDKLISQILLLYAEYYNNLLKPLIDSNELAKKKLIKFEKKLASQIKTVKFLSGKSNLDALKELEETVKSTEQEIFDLSNDIDNLCIQYKQSIIDLYASMQENIKNDKFQFYLPKNNPFSCFFETIVQDRFSRNEDEILEKNIHIFKIQLSSMERKLIRFNDNQKNSSEATDLKIKIIKNKLKTYSQEEIFLKKLLNKTKSENNNSVHSDVYNLAKDLGQQYMDELKEKFKIDTSIFLSEKKEDVPNIDESSDSEDDYLSENTKFFDAYESPDKLFEEENKEKNEKIKKISEIKKKILNIGSKKSSLRLALKKLEETLDLEETVEEKPVEPLVKTLAMKKEEDKIQKELYMENRNKALLRLKEYKMKKMKDSTTVSTSSLNSKQLETEKTAKKPYVPKSKQRILPTSFGQKIKIFKKEESILSESPNSQVMSNLPLEPTPPLLDTSSNISINPPPAPPPPPPPLIGLEKTSTLPTPPSLPINAPLPPPPPPLDLFANNTFKPAPPPPPLLLPLISEKVVKPKENSKSSENRKENVQIEFDINEIKNFKFKKSSKSPPKKENSSTNQFNSWETLMNEIKNNGGRKLKNITNETSNRKTKCDLDLPHKSKLELDLTSILSERSKFFNLDDEECSDSDSSWDN